MSNDWTLKKVIEELRSAIYEGHKVKDELAKDGIQLSDNVEASLDGKMEGYSEAISIIESYIGDKSGGSESYASFQ